MGPSGTKSSVTNRVFLVGCPRSGTTLLQSMLAAHPAIRSFPESHFYRLLPAPLIGRLGIASGRIREQLRRFCAELGRPELLARFPATRRMRPLSDAFIATLDALAAERAATTWVEKTPDHVHRVRLIDQMVPTARYLHLIRNGIDVVASLFDVTRRHPAEWGGAWDADRCVRKWNASIAATRRHRGQPRHQAVRYERLVADPEQELRGICEFLSLEYQAAMLDQRESVVEALVAAEPWKQGVAGPVQTSSEDKFQRLFDANLQARIRAGLAEVGDL